MGELAVVGHDDVRLRFYVFFLFPVVLFAVLRIRIY